MPACSQQILGHRLNLLQGIDKLNPACLAASTRMNLCLDYPAITAQVPGDTHKFIDRTGHIPFRNGDLILTEQGLGLEFMDIHNFNRWFFNIDCLEAGYFVGKPV